MKTTVACSRPSDGPTVGKARELLKEEGENARDLGKKGTQRTVIQKVRVAF